MKKYLRMSGNILAYGGIYIGLQVFVFFVFTAVFTFVKEFYNQAPVDIEVASQSFLMENSNVVLILSAALSLIIYAGLLRYRGERLLNYCSFKRISLINAVLIIALALGVNILFESILSQLPVDNLFPDYNETIESIIGGGQNPIIVLLGVGILIPIFEEVLFRGLVLTELKKHLNIKAVILIQALLFGIFHMNMLQGIYASLLGVILGLLYVWTGSIWAPIIGHMIFNTSSLFYEYINSSGSHLIIAAAGITITVATIIMLYRVNNKKKKRIINNKFTSQE